MPRKGTSKLRPNRLSRERRTELVDKWRPLAMGIANRGVGRHLPADERHAAADHGLAKAARHFDPGRDRSFGTYAGWWVHSYVQTAWLKQRTGGFVGAGGRAMVKEEEHGEAVLAGLVRSHRGREHDHEAGVDADDFWAEVTRCLPRRLRRVLTGIYRYGASLEKVAVREQVSRHRLQQMHDDAIARIRFEVLCGRLTLGQEVRSWA